MGVLATWQLAKANRQSMNMEGSFQHILTDLTAFIATAIASAVILATDWRRATAWPRVVLCAGGPCELR
jgi:cobalt-zinc-cadmium efflux system protein